MHLKRFNKAELQSVSSEVRVTTFEGRVGFYKELGYTDLRSTMLATMFFTNLAATKVAQQGGNVVSCSVEEWHEGEYTVVVIFSLSKDATLVEPYSFLNY